MVIEEQQVDGAVLLGVGVKRLTADVAAPFPQTIAEIIERAGNHLVLDISEVEFMDSCGLGAMVAVRKMVGPTGSLKLCGVSEQVLSLFKLTSMLQVFDVYDDTEQALAA